MNVIDRMTSTIATAVKWLSLAMVIVTVIIVVLRYLFATGAIMLQESVMYMHGILFLLGIPYGIKQGTHVRVDIVYNRLTDTGRRYVDGLGHIFLLAPVAVFIIVTSWPYVAASWRVLEGSSEVGGLPGIFLLKTLIPVTAGLMLLQALSEIVRLWRSPPPVPETPA